MSISLIVTTFNKPDELFLVLKSIECQKLIPSEVIIADDGSNEKTKKLISEYSKNSKLKIIHSFQENLGFRAAESRNRAIAKSSCEYIVLIDGDTILHPNFVKDHLNSAEQGYFVQGSRVLLSEKETKNALARTIVNFSFFSSNLKNRKNAIYSKLLSSVFSSKKKYLHGIKSCNMAFYKKDCINVNGFNNDFEGWGREDSEFVVRLINSGVNRKNVRFNVIQFHLWHNENPRMSLRQNDAILEHAIINHSQWCENGINSIGKNES